MQTADRIEVDGVTFSVQFQGFHVPMEVHAGTGGRATLTTWCFGHQFTALRDCVFVGPDGLHLDHQTLAAHVLSQSEVPEELFAELSPLALWWAAGGGTDTVMQQVLPPDQWTPLGSVQARLRPWTEAERQDALAHNVNGEGDTSQFDLVGYVETMVKASLVALSPQMPLKELDAPATQALLRMVLDLNVVEPVTLAAMDSAETRAEAAQRVLRLCETLGWTPSKVWSTPAAEIDRLLTLIDLTQGAKAHGRRSSGLHDHPDAVVIRIEDD